MDREIINRIIQSADEIISGKDDKVRLSLCALFARGHVLIEDVPGVGKTTLVKLLGKLINLKVSRIQFTNDILPADIIGTNIYYKQDNEFKFHPGPIFGEVILADELNRAPPKTQSALLQAMEEKHVTSDGSTYELPDIFTVFATQNPHSQIGTYDLPESQLDRFTMKFDIGYPDKAATLKMLQLDARDEKLNNTQAIIQVTDLVEIQNEVKKIHADESILEYIYNLLNYSRENSKYLPLSNRCGLDLVKVSKAWAYIAQRDYIIPDDIQEVFPFVAGHRLIHPGQTTVGKEQAFANEILENVAIR